MRNYAKFSGRARRAEYWYFTLFALLIAIGVMLVESFLGTFSEEAGIGVVSGLYLLAITVPGLAVMVRRLHDTGRSGWWYFISLIPLIGGLVLLFFLAQDSEPGENDFGPNPKESLA
jgi:uncharacterized membrane protein YhaH (DUF805 family)